MMPTLLTPVHHLTAARGGAAVASLLPPQAGDGHREAHPRPPARRALQVELPAELESAVSHRLPAYSGPSVLGVEPAAVVTDLDVGEHAVEAQLYPDVSGLGVAADVRERLLDQARELLARLVGEPGREFVCYHQFEFVPPTGHSPVQVDEVLQRRDERALQRLFEAQLEDGGAESFYGAFEGLGRVLQGRVRVPSRDNLHDLYLLQRVDDILEGAVVKLPGQPVAFGFPDLFQHALGTLALRHIVGDDTHGCIIVVGYCAHVDLDVDQGAVLAPVLPLAEGAVSLLPDTSDVEVNALIIVGDDVIESHLFELIFRVAQRAKQGVVGIEHTPALRVHEEDVLLRLLDHRAVERLTLLEGRLLALALRQVYNGGHPDPTPRVG